MLQVMVGSRAIVFNLTSENKETTHAISEFPKVQDFMDPEAHTESILTMNQTFRTSKALYGSSFREICLQKQELLSNFQGSLLMKRQTI